MKYVVKFYDDNEEILGSDGTAIVRGLKTVRGVRKRMKHYHFSPRANRYVIYQVTGDNFYDKRNWREVDQGHVADLQWGE